jgi:hypothetical protein
MSRNSKIPLLALILPLLVSLACNFSAGGSDSEAESPSAAVPTSDSSGTIRTIPTTEPGAEPTSLPAIPSSSSSSDGNTEDDVLVMKEPIYIQDERNLITVFLFENLDISAGVEDIEYNVIVSDAAGESIKTETGYIDFIPANGRIGVASQMYLEEGQVAEAVDIEWTYYTDASGSINDPFTFENSRYFFDPFWDRFSAVMVNNDSEAYTNVRVDVIAFDSAGVVIGGGFTNVGFIPGNDQVGISINGYVSDDPVTYEFFPRMNILSNTIDNADLSQNLTVVQSGFFYDETTLGGGFLVQNTGDQVMKDAQYTISIYEEDGSVAQVVTNYMNLLWPGQTFGISPGTVELSEGAAPTEFKVYLKSGILEDQEFSTNPLTATDVTFMPDPDFPKVSVTINNSQSAIVDNPYLTVLLFNAEDEIIGGNFSYPDPIPANGSLTYEIFVTQVTADAPARVEAYVTLTSW